jgi:hypothetical protein
MDENANNKNKNKNNKAIIRDGRAPLAAKNVVKCTQYKIVC